MLAEFLLSPGDDGSRLDEDQSLTPSGPVSREPRPEDAIGRPDARTPDASLIDRQLMSEGEDFELQGKAGAKGVAQQGSECL